MSKIEKMYFFYILECSDKTLYSGITVDLGRRTREHNFSQRGSKYTRSRRPVRLVFSKEFQSRSEASKEEARIKKLPREEKLKIVNY